MSRDTLCGIAHMFLHGGSVDTLGYLMKLLRMLLALTWVGLINL